eukprot:Rhum_TRINITY_DN8238_c1_g1::Rhum_TRINITY_DN8238_c1_g1_i1::g.26679::m.26679
MMFSCRCTDSIWISFTMFMISASPFDFSDSTFTAITPNVRRFVALNTSEKAPEPSFFVRVQGSFRPLPNVSRIAVCIACSLFISVIIFSESFKTCVSVASRSGFCSNRTFFVLYSTFSWSVSFEYVTMISIGVLRPCRSTSIRGVSWPWWSRTHRSKRVAGRSCPSSSTVVEWPRFQIACRIGRRSSGSESYTSDANAAEPWSAAAYSSNTLMAGTHGSSIRNEPAVALYDRMPPICFTARRTCASRADVSPLRGLKMPWSMLLSSPPACPTLALRPVRTDPVRDRCHEGPPSAAALSSSSEFVGESFFDWTTSSRPSSLFAFTQNTMLELPAAPT